MNLIRKIFVLLVLGLLSGIGQGTMWADELGDNNFYANSRLENLVAAAETYARTHTGVYPKVISDLTEGPVVFLKNNSCDKEGHGFAFSCACKQDGSGCLFTATPIIMGKTGSGVFEKVAGTPGKFSSNEFKQAQMIDSSENLIQPNVPTEVPETKKEEVSENLKEPEMIPPAATEVQAPTLPAVVETDAAVTVQPNVPMDVPEIKKEEASANSGETTPAMPAPAVTEVQAPTDLDVAVTDPVVSDQPKETPDAGEPVTVEEDQPQTNEPSGKPALNTEIKNNKGNFSGNFR